MRWDNEAFHSGRMSGPQVAPQRGQNGFAALALPPDESRRADASKSEEESQDWPGQRPDETAARRLSTK
jgi:hypothetical protein